MKTTRREFLKKSTLAVASTSLLSLSLFAAEKKEKKVMGLQLYSVRADMKKDPKATLKALAEMGYVNVEHASYVDRKFYGFNVNEFKKIVDDLGLKMTSGHTQFGNQHWDEAKNDFTDLWKYTVEDAATLGQDFMVTPNMTRDQYTVYENLMKLMERYNKAGEFCKKSGMKFGYHNHDFEFKQKHNDVYVFDIIMNNTDPSLVYQQLDMGNLYTTGNKPVDIIKKYPGRFASMHVKDVVKEGEKWENVVLGTGVAGVKEVLEYSAKVGGTYHFMIEQEEYQQNTPLDAMKLDLAAMKKWSY